MTFDMYISIMSYLTCIFEDTT